MLVTLHPYYIKKWWRFRAYRGLENSSRIEQKAPEKTAYASFECLPKSLLLRVTVKVYCTSPYYY